MLNAQRGRLDCQLGDGPYCMLDLSTQGQNYYNSSEDLYTDEDEDYIVNRLQIPLGRSNLDLAFDELKQHKNLGSITITSVLTFDDLQEQFRMERYQQVSVPLHQLNLFPKQGVKGVVRGSLLARIDQLPLPQYLKQNKMFETAYTRQQPYTGLQKQQSEGQDSVQNAQVPKMVFAFAHSPEVAIEINKKVHLDHFHYRINPYYLKKEGNEQTDFYLKTLDNEGRLILDFKLKNTQQSWVKVTFPRSKVLITKIVFSQGVELDNISLHYMILVKTLLHYSTLALVPVSTHTTLLIPRAPIDDFLRSLEMDDRHQFVGNTLDLLSDVVTLQQLEKAIGDYLGYRQKQTVAVADAASRASAIQAKYQRMHDVTLEVVKHLEGIGISIVRLFDNNPTFETQDVKLLALLQQKLLNQDQITEIALTLAKFQRSSLSP
ncbi:hypothetical protein FGO68_gene1457 [Halteria grandinella]|uniref:Uncharacterized protein n=1 Tax=Halteria grandinella TaxID=5974 RepID=A0A8J8T359_HALGN|nr:hypothetical protein FGO68_gene1457 [Halteria grandinella]